MSGFAAQLKHSCLIQRADAGLPDLFGHTIQTWPDAETVPCLIQSVRGQQILGPVLGGQVISDVRIYFLPFAIDEQDRVKDVTPGHIPATYAVQFVEDAGGQGSHLEVFAKAITSGEEPS